MDVPNRLARWFAAVGGRVGGRLGGLARGLRIGLGLGAAPPRVADRIDADACGPWPEGGLLVGGAVRDLLLGRTPLDFDWMVPDPAVAAKRHAERLGGSAFELDAARRQWRVVAHVASAARASEAPPSATVVHDFVPRPVDVGDDLRARDFTVDAIAARRDGHLIDPTHGRDDLGTRTLRMVAERNLAADPLRVLRAVRLAVTLGLRLEPATATAVRSVGDRLADDRLERPAWERVGAELDRILAAPAAARGMRMLAELDLLRSFLPELERGRGLEQGGFHHLDVLDHQIAALEQLVAGFPDADLALRWATLLHDVAKPVTRATHEDGRVHFYGHAPEGAEIAARMLRRLRAPEARVRRVAALVKDHMVQLPADERGARRFAHRRRGLLPDLLSLMLADREASRGPRSTEASREAYRVGVSRVLAARAAVPDTPPLLDGDQVMRELGLDEGPEVGRALAFVREAEAVGDIGTPDEARAALRRFAEAQGWIGPVDGR